MDLRNLRDGLSPGERCNERRRRLEQELELDLTHTRTDDEHAGEADEKNCEQMFGMVPLPVGYAGPLTFLCSSGEKTTVHLPLATTEGALVASINRGCKVLCETDVHMLSTHHRMTSSIAFQIGGASGENKREKST